jgi:hypothetical protein
MSCNSCHALPGGMMAHPATQLYWMEDRTATPGTKLRAAIPQVHHRERLDLYPLGYSPPGLGYGGFYMPVGSGLWNYGNYARFLPWTHPAQNGAH